MACGGTKGNPNPDPLLAKSPNALRERVIEHKRGRCGVHDHAIFVPHCSTFLQYDSGVYPRWVEVARRSPWSGASSSGAAQTTRGRAQLLLIATNDHAHAVGRRRLAQSSPTPAVRAVRENGPAPASLRPQRRASCRRALRLRRFRLGLSALLSGSASRPSRWSPLASVFHEAPPSAAVSLSG